MKRAAVFFADGFEEIEALSPVDYLRRAGIEVKTVSVFTESENSKKVTGSHKIQILTDMTLDDFLAEYSSDLPDCVICPGGTKGAEHLSNCQELLDFLEKCNDKGRYVAAICASPAVVLGKTNIPDNKNWTCYPGMETESNVLYVKNYSNKTFITDGNLITARGAGASEEFAMELVRLLTDSTTAKKIHDGCQMR